MPLKKDRTATPVRRTQRARREATIQRLVNATIESILEVGYARTSVKEICTRAGVSHGGLFRHFPSLLTLIMAAADEVAQRQIAQVQAALANVEADADPLLTTLMQLRQACRTPVNAVFYELLVAARTDEQLKTAMAGFSARYAMAIREAAERIPVARHLPDNQRFLLLTTILHLFDGEALVGTVYPVSDMEAQRISLLMDTFRHLAQH